MENDTDMKRKLLLFLCLVFLVVCGCYHNCESPFLDAPTLNANGFNTCIAVMGKYTYPVKKMKYYPYWSDEGDTIKVCGWIEHSNGNPIKASDSLDLMFSMSDDSITALDSSYHGAGLPFECAVCLMDSIDLEKKCYITGTLSFDPKYKLIGGPPDFSSCVCPQYSIRVVKIENQN